MSRRCRSRRGPAVAALAAATVALAACGGGVPTDPAARPDRPARVGPTIAATVDSALFTVDCTFSHRAQDDPIVWFGRPGASHMHDFFGATGVDASSTADDLRGGDTTCEDRRDTAAYWAPTLYDGPTPVDPLVARAYYRAAVGTDVTEVQAPPAGIQLLAGDMHRAAGDWPDLDQVAWGCGLRPRALHREPPTTCTPRSPLTLRLVFPDCWDGRDVTSADHRAHAAYSTGGRCPAEHPVPIVQVQLSIQYPVWRPTPGRPSPDAGSLTLASGRFEGAHGDFFNTWDQARLERQTDLCIRALANCTIG